MRQGGTGYQRIVADISARIASGELAPGDRVPSTRALTQQWGVAMATATKALTALRQDGLVRPVPGVGTVVAAPGSMGTATASRRTARDHGGATDRTRLVRTAMALANDDGLAGLSMRRLATELGVPTMSLYRLIRGKEHLIIMMADEAVGELTVPRAAPGQWRPFVERVARDQWRLYRRYPWLAGAISMTRPQVAPRLLALADHMLGAFAAYGLDPPTLLNVHLTVFGVVRGLAVNIEPELQAERDTGLTADEWTDTQQGALRTLNSGQYPAMAALMANDIPLELDRLFEFTLQRLLDGLAPVLDAARGQPG